MSMMVTLLGKEKTRLLYSLGSFVGPGRAGIHRIVLARETQGGCREWRTGILDIPYGEELRSCRRWAEEPMHDDDVRPIRPLAVGECVTALPCA